MGRRVLVLGCVFVYSLAVGVDYGGTFRVRLLGVFYVLVDKWCFCVVLILDSLMWAIYIVMTEWLITSQQTFVLWIHIILTSLIFTNCNDNPDESTNDAGAVFMRDREHEAFLGRAMNFIRKLLKNQMGLQHRLLGRIKSNYQWSNLVEWFEFSASLATQSIRNWQ